MTATAHALVGASIALKISNPAIALPLVFISHFVFDKLPHWDPMTNHDTKSKRAIFWQTITDVVLGYAIIMILFVVKINPPLTLPLNPDSIGVNLSTSLPLFLSTFQPLFYLYLAAFIAQLPDWLEVPYFLNLPNFLRADWNYKLQHWVHDVGFNSRMQAPWGIITQVIVCILFLGWALL